MKKLILIVAAFVAMSTNAFAQLGSASSDLVYTPVTPCRVLDTRTSQGGTGAITANGTKHFKVWGQTSFAAQGGAASNCGLTAGSSIAAVAMNFTVVTPAAGGFITAYPFGGALPVAATVNFQVGDIARGDFTIAKVTQSGTDHLSIFSASLADVVGDVTGYYSKPVVTALQCIDVAGTSALVPASVTDFILGAPACPAGYTSVGMDFLSDNGQLLRKDGSRNSLYLRNSSASIATATPYSVCCRIPGR